MTQNQPNYAPEENAVPEAIGFEGFVIEPARGRLLGRDGGEIAIRPKAFELLAVLAGAGGRPLGKAELLDRIWARVNVTEDSLFQAVKDARRAIDDGEGRLLRHLPRRGYLLDCRLSLVDSNAAPPAITHQDDRPSLAVLPFRLLGEAGHAYLAEGLVEEISIALSRFRWLIVIAHASAARSGAGDGEDVAAIGSRLGARYLVDGSFGGEGGSLLVRCRLIDAQSTRQIWQESFRAGRGEIVALYETMTGAIAAAMEPRLLKAEIDRVLRKGTGDLDAFDCYLRALPGYYARSRGGNASAIALLERALARDPHFVLARALLARCVATAIWLGAEQDYQFGKQRALELAREALTADRSDPQILALCGHLFSVLGGEHDEGRALLDLSLRLNPNSAEAWRLGAWVAVWSGEADLALSRAAEAERLDPLSPLQADLLAVRSAALFYAGRYDEAVTAARRSLANVPEATTPRRYLTAALVHAGDLPGARAELAELVRLQPNASLGRTRAMHPLRDKASLERYVEALRQAGMPE
ncbi:winged helix-turn-helix domain-containing protein [Bosea lupini]|nr:winged helix-turn-helix domain-containing protein [Bosea lupini]